MIMCSSTIFSALLLVVLLAISIMTPAFGFVHSGVATFTELSRRQHLLHQYAQSTTLPMAKKGFGSTPSPTTPQKKKSKKKSSTSPSSQTAAVAPSEPKIDDGDTVNFQPFDDSPPDVSQGKIALERMRRQRAEQRNQELQQLQDVQQVDQLVRESPEAAVIPERVAQRMGKRMLPFVGIPLFGSMASFVGFWYMATQRDMEFQPVLVASTSLVLLAVGIVGITYSIMSTSWDDDREGSLLGTDEFSQNLDNIKTGLSRSRENAILRDKMDAGVFSPDELDQTAQQQKKKVASFSKKIGDEME